MHTIGEILEAKARQGVVGVSTDATVLDAVRQMDEGNMGSVLVIDGKQLVGIFTERDLMRRVVLKGKDAATTKVTEVMTTDVIYTQPGESSPQVMAMMSEKRCRHLPVMDKDQLVGVVSVGDLMKDISKQQQVELSFLKDFIAG